MNRFDNIEINLEELYLSLTEKTIKIQQIRKPAFLNLINLYWQYFFVKTGVRNRLLYAGFILG